jgi:hypothetical protein
MSARYPYPLPTTYSPTSNPPYLSQPPPPPPLSAIHTARLSAVPGSSSPGGPSSSSSSFVSSSPHAQHLQQDRRWSPTSPPSVASPGPSPGSFLRGAGAVNPPASTHDSNLSALAQSAPRSSSPMATRGPSGLVAEYNPQQWGTRGAAGGASYIPHSALPPSTRRSVDDGGKRYSNSARIHIIYWPSPEIHIESQAGMIELQSNYSNHGSRPESSSALLSCCRSKRICTYSTPPFDQTAAFTWLSTASPDGHSEPLVGWGVRQSSERSHDHFSP